MIHEYVNLKQIARRLSRAPSTVRSWRYREQFAIPFPPPVISRSHRGALVWDWVIVEAWWLHGTRVVSKWGIAR